MPVRKPSQPDKKIGNKNANQIRLAFSFKSNILDDQISFIIVQTLFIFLI
ncbi:hypothetical protein URS_1482 [Acinetobacter ursingii]|nr:hypothetical protein URS_1482 [Acinetobacter ursingii]